MTFENYLKLKILYKFYVDTVLIICLHITYGQLHAKQAELGGCQRPPCPQNPRYLLFSPFKKNLLFPALCIDSIRVYFRLTHLSY